MKQSKTLIALAFTCICCSQTKAQNPYDAIGKKTTMLTLTNGKYPEYIPYDSIQRIGSIVINVKRLTVLSFLDRDSLNMAPEVSSRWWAPDPLTQKYAPISPYAFSLNNPILFKDADGRVVVDANGNAITYDRGKDGVVKWSENATADVQKVGNAMLTTKFGEQAFNKWQSAKTAITIVIDKETAPEDKRYAETKPNAFAEDGGGKTNADGQYESATVFFYEKNIEMNRAEGSGERFAGASETETYGAVGTHEVYHNEKKQINLDYMKPDELNEQSPSKNLPINSEVNFRQEYHEKNPGQKNAGPWKEPYKAKGYEGIKQKK